MSAISHYRFFVLRLIGTEEYVCGSDDGGWWWKGDIVHATTHHNAVEIYRTRQDIPYWDGAETEIIEVTAMYSVEPVSNDKVPAR